MKRAFIRFPLLCALLFAACAFPHAPEEGREPPSAVPSASSSVSAGDAVSPVDGTAASSRERRKLSIVVIRKGTFIPDVLRISRGTSVMWVNRDAAAHSIVGDALPELRSDVLSEGMPYGYLFRDAGTFPYHCGEHPEMKGTVIVQE